MICPICGENAPIQNYVACFSKIAICSDHFRMSFMLKDLTKPVHYMIQFQDEQNQCRVYAYRAGGKYTVDTTLLCANGNIVGTFELFIEPTFDANERPNIDEILARLMSLMAFE